MKKIIFFLIAFLVLFVGITKAQEKKSATYIPEIGKYKYEIYVPVPKSYKNPFYAGSWQIKDGDWQKCELQTDESGKYYFTIISFNTMIQFYVSDYQHPVAMIKTEYYSRDNRCYHVGLCNGEIATEREAKFPEPGMYGDGFIRFTDDGDYLLVYFNNSRIDNKGLWPVFMSSAADWKLQYQSITDASGWGSARLKKSNNKTDSTQNKNNMYFGYGSLYNNNVNDVLFPDIRESLFLSEKKNGLMIPMYFK